MINAITNGQLSSVQWILEKGGSTFTKNYQMNRLWGFRLACENGHLDIAKYLIENDPNFNVNKKNDEGHNCFTYLKTYNKVQPFFFL